MLYNMHRAVILAIAQLSGFIYQHYFFVNGGPVFGVYS